MLNQNKKTMKLVESLNGGEITVFSHFRVITPTAKTNITDTTQFQISIEMKSNDKKLTVE